jgi:hypothetical protein
MHFEFWMDVWKWLEHVWLQSACLGWSEQNWLQSRVWRTGVLEPVPPGLFQASDKLLM